MSTRPMQIHYRCIQCDSITQWQVKAPADNAGHTCHACGYKLTNQASQAHTKLNDIETCLICGKQDFYTQKNFNRPLGLAIVVIGAIFSPMTYGASLIACAIIDAALYWGLPWAKVCYICHAIYTGLKLEKPSNNFNLEHLEDYEQQALWSRLKQAIKAGNNTEQKLH